LYFQLDQPRKASVIVDMRTPGQAKLDAAAGPICRTFDKKELQNQVDWQNTAWSYEKRHARFPKDFYCSNQQASANGPLRATARGI